MIKHLCWHFSDLFAFEFCFPYKPGPATKVNCYLRKTIIHWKTKSITFDPTLVTQRFQKCFTQCKCCIFNRVMFVNMKITFHANRKIYVPMTSKLIKHVIEECNTRL